MIKQEYYSADASKSEKIEYVYDSMDQLIQTKEYLIQDDKKNGSVNTGWYNEDGTMNYPPNNGAISGTEKVIELKPGQTLGRYGSIGPKSDFVTVLPVQRQIVCLYHQVLILLFIQRFKF